MSGVNKVIADLYIEGKSIPQISVITSIPRSTVRNRLVKVGVSIRSRAQAVHLAAMQGRLGSGMRGRKRDFTEEHKKNISVGKLQKDIGKGVSLKPNGYIEFTKGENKSRGEHRVVMEMIVGRRLSKGEVVHHINHNRSDNHPENLQLMSRSDHASHHATINHKNRKRSQEGKFL
tara:strand:+ start:52 stop:576 length:525 start_codon:yes stop_codon:yes gene_type:complete